MYHLTSLENVESIERTGIRANRRGEIFIVADPLVANEIAKSQLFLDVYAAFGIDESAITGRVIADRVAEYTAPYHRIILQDHISPDEIFLWGEFDTIHDRPVEWDYVVGEHFGKTRTRVDMDFTIHRRNT